MTEKFILMAEDDPNDVVLTEMALRKCQINNRLIVVSDGQEALDFLFSRDKYEGRTEQPAVILLDLKLPLINGLEVLRQIRAEERIHLLPVVVLSASIDEKDKKESLRMGANDFQNKPISFDKFVDLIRQICYEWLSD